MRLLRGAPQTRDELAVSLALAISLLEVLERPDPLAGGEAWQDLIQKTRERDAVYAASQDAFLPMEPHLQYFVQALLSGIGWEIFDSSCNNLAASATVFLSDYPLNKILGAMDTAQQRIELLKSRYGRVPSM